MILYNGSINLSKNTGCDEEKEQNLRPNCNVTPYYDKKKLQSDKKKMLQWNATTFKLIKRTTVPRK